MTGHILKFERPTANVAESRKRRRIDGDDERFGRFHRADAEHLIYRCRDRLCKARTLRPILHADKDDGAVGVRAAREDVKSVDGHDSALPINLALRRLLDLVHNFLRLVRGGSRGELNRNHHIALIFFGNKGGREILIDERSHAADDQQEHNGNPRFADRVCDDADIAFAGTVEPIVESIEEAIEESLFRIFLLRLQHERAERGCECECNERGKRHRDGDGECKLFIQDAHHAAEECNGDKDRREDERDRDDRSLHLRHRALGGVNRRESAFHMMLDVLNDDDRVIDDETDRKNHRKQCQCVDREIEQHKRAERSDKRHRNREQRDHRRAPALQEHEDDKNDEEQRLDKGMHNFANGGVDVVRTVKDRLHLESGREIRLGIIQNLAHLGDGRHCVRIGGELNAETDGRIAVKFCDNIVLPLSRLDSRNVLQTNEGAVLARGDDNVAKFLRRRESSLYLARELLFLTVDRRHSADRARGRLHVLLVDRRRDVRDGES